MTKCVLSALQSRCAQHAITMTHTHNPQSKDKSCGKRDQSTSRKTAFIITTTIVTVVVSKTFRQNKYYEPSMSVCDMLQLLKYKIKSKFVPLQAVMEYGGSGGRPIVPLTLKMEVVTFGAHLLKGWVCRRTALDVSEMRRFSSS